MDVTSAGVSSLGGEWEKEVPGHVVPTYNTTNTYSNNDSASIALRLRNVGAASSRVRIATPDGPLQRTTRGRSSLLSFPPPPPQPLILIMILFSPRCVPVSRHSRGHCRRSPLLRLRNSCFRPQPAAHPRAAQMLRRSSTCYPIRRGRTGTRANTDVRAQVQAHYNVTP